MALADIPGLGAYLQERQLNQQAPLQQLRQVSGALGLSNAIQAQQDAGALRDALAASGGDPGAALKAALASGNVGAAAKLAPIVTAQQKANAPTVVPPNSTLLYGDGRQTQVAGPAPKAPAPLIRDNFPIDASRVQPHISLDNGQTWTPLEGSAPQPRFNPKQSDVVRRAVVGQDANGNQVVNWVTPTGVEKSITLPTKAIGTGNIDFSRGKALQLKFLGAIQAPQQYLQRVAAYREIRNTGDNAQAVLMAAQALKDSLRFGGRQAEGKIDALLGNSFRGGSIFERIDNWAQTMATGTPDPKVMQRLDALIGASQRSALTQVQMYTKNYANNARALKMELGKITGGPQVYGSTVIFPDGDMAVFSNQQAVQQAVSKWQQAHP